MKKLLCVALCAVAGSACAATGNLNAKSDTGYYVGAQAGYAQSTYKSSDFSGHNLDKSGFAGRIDAGYLYTPNFAIEVGGTYLPTIQQGGLSLLESRYSIDVFAKGILPIQNNFSVFGKAGLAWYTQEATAVYGLSAGGRHGTERAVVPAFGLGASYNFTPQWSADVDYTYYFKKGGIHEDHNFAATHFIAVGLAYNFGA